MGAINLVLVLLMTDWRDRCCWRYNRGNRCKKWNCNYDHRCNYCGSYNHGRYNCPKRKHEGWEGYNKGHKPNLSVTVTFRLSLLGSANIKNQKIKEKATPRKILINCLCSTSSPCAILFQRLRQIISKTLTYKM